MASLALALLFGGDCAMLGSAFAGTEEAPGEVVHKSVLIPESQKTVKVPFKVLRGMASLEAIRDRLDVEDADRVELEAIGAEGMEISVPARGSARTIVRDMIKHLCSSISYGGADSLARPARAVLEGSRPRSSSSSPLRRGGSRTSGRRRHRMNGRRENAERASCNAGLCKPAVLHSRVLSPSSSTRPRATAPGPLARRVSPAPGWRCTHSATTAARGGGDSVSGSALRTPNSLDSITRPAAAAAARPADDTDAADARPLPQHQHGDQRVTCAEREPDAELPRRSATAPAIIA